MLKKIFQAQVKTILINFILSCFIIISLSHNNSNEGKQINFIIFITIFIIHIAYSFIFLSSFFYFLFKVKFLIHVPIFVLLVFDLFFLYKIFEDPTYDLYAYSVIFTSITLIIIWLFCSRNIPSPPVGRRMKLGR